jgi:hypothetical protein
MRYLFIFILLCGSVIGQETDQRIVKEIEFCSQWYTKMQEEEFYKDWKNCDLSKMSQKEKRFFILYQEGRLESRLKKVERYVVATMRPSPERYQIYYSLHNMRVLLASDRETLILDLMLEYPNLQKDLQFYADQVTHYNEDNQLNEMSIFRQAVP